MGSSGCSSHFTLMNLSHLLYSQTFFNHLLPVGVVASCTDLLLWRLLERSYAPIEKIFNSHKDLWMVEDLLFQTPSGKIQNSDLKVEREDH